VEGTESRCRGVDLPHSGTEGRILDVVFHSLAGEDQDRMTSSIMVLCALNPFRDGETVDGPPHKLSTNAGNVCKRKGEDKNVSE
jgi:hypothetical protein